MENLPTAHDNKNAIISNNKKMWGGEGEKGKNSRFEKQYLTFSSDSMIWNFRTSDA